MPDIAADVLMVIGLALFYGSAMPMMYILATLNLMVVYMKETLFIYYVYKKPPQFDIRATTYSY